MAIAISAELVKSSGRRDQACRADTGENGNMIGRFVGRAGRSLAGAATAVALAGGLTAAPQPAHALGTGAAVGIGLGAFALGTALASPYYYYPGAYYAYPPAYYPPAYYPPYPPPRSCWNPYDGRYYPC
jgi:hypothetical protein